MLVLPSSSGVDQLVMLWSTDRFPDVVNGGSGFTPRAGSTRPGGRPETSRTRRASTTCAAMGVRSVVVLRDRVGGTPWETAINLPVD